MMPVTCSRNWLPEQIRKTWATPACCPSIFPRPFGPRSRGPSAPSLPTGWWNWIYSGLGAHLVLVTERREARLPELAEIRGQVAREYLAQRRQVLKDQAYQKLREGYEIIIEPAEEAEGSAVAVNTAPLAPEKEAK